MKLLGSGGDVNCVKAGRFGVRGVVQAVPIVRAHIGVA